MNDGGLVRKSADETTDCDSSTDAGNPGRVDEPSQLARAPVFKLDAVLSDSLCRWPVRVTSWPSPSFTEFFRRTEAMNSVAPRVCNLGLPWLPKNYDVLKSFDAERWAAKFLETLHDNPEIVIDHDLMVGWFANALMRGYDEHYWQTSEYKRKVRHALFPWWNWRHWIKSRRQS